MQQEQNTSAFDFPIRVYYEDTDAGGIVFYANYLKFFERARTEWLRALGVEQDVWLNQDIAFVVRHVEMNNRSAAVFNDLLNVKSRITELKKASMVFSQELFDSQGKLLVDAKVKVACVRLSSMKPSAIPDEILGVLSRVR